MDFNKLFRLQKDLDAQIIEEHNLKDEVLFSQKSLALQVEVGKLADETRCFKYWSNKAPAKREIILEEYIDCLHFILSIGVDKNFDDITPSLAKFNYNITEQFLDLYVDINDFVICSSKDHYITLFEDFLSLGKNLGFSELEIESEYIGKNEFNQERQSSNY
ncbi:dUTP diphosphatase [Clostridium neuense]|uniref:dUTP diphosphatase n=1 Tax=Clostridium neuense TaxID=1728934 RepID=A0ABW8TFW6_9CLOT